MAHNADLVSFIIEHNDAFKSQGRLASLYSDFPLHRELNPDGYEANIAAWQQALASAALAGKLPTHKVAKGAPRKTASQNASGSDLTLSDPAGNPFVLHSGEELIRALETTKLGRPQALASVISEASAKKDFVPLESFLLATTSFSSKPGFLSSFSPWSIFSWGLRQVGLPVDSSSQRLPHDTYVIRQNLENIAFGVLDYIRKHSDSFVFTTQAFAQVLGAALPSDTVLSPLAIQLLLLHMSRDMQPPVAVFSPESKIVKFSSSHSAPEPISDADIRIAQLKSIIESTSFSILSLEARAAKTLEDIKDALAKQNRPTAMAGLRKKKLIEGSLEKRREMLLQLETVLLDIEEASTRAETVKQLSSSVDILKSLNLSVGSPEAVEKIMDALQEERETGAAISSVLNEKVTIDETEIEAELEELEEIKKKEEQEERERKEAEELDKRLAEAGIQAPTGVPNLPSTESRPTEDIQKLLDRLALKDD